MILDRKWAGVVLAAGVCLAAPAAGRVAAQEAGGESEATCPGGTQAALTAIDRLAASLSICKEPTTTAARRIASIAKSCRSPAVRARAAAALRRGISIFTHPTREVAAAMQDLCGYDHDCALAAISILGRGISSFDYPTIDVAGVIVRVAQQAPYEDVKAAALAQLREGLSSLTPEVDEAIRAVEKCATSAASVAKLSERITASNGRLFD